MHIHELMGNFGPQKKEEGLVLGLAVEALPLGEANKPRTGSTLQAGVLNHVRLAPFCGTIYLLHFTPV
jgi:hypothetical protein